jgi:hypothetical protein
MARGRGVNVEYRITNTESERNHVRVAGVGLPKSSADIEVSIVGKPPPDYARIRGQVASTFSPRFSA